MYLIRYGQDVIYDPRDDERQITGSELTLDMVEPGQLTFTMSRFHPLAGKIRKKVRFPEIVVEEDGMEVFRGRVIDTESDYYGSTTYICEGERAYLNDIRLPRYTTDRDMEDEDWTGAVAPSSVSDYFVWLVNRYDARVLPRDGFAIGINQGRLLSSERIYRHSDERLSVWDAIKGDILEKLGGFVRVRYAPDGTRLLDLMAGTDRTTSQHVEFGVNLLDFVHHTDSTDYVTRIIPIGETVEVSHLEPVLDDDGNQSIDSDGNPVWTKVVDVEAGREVTIEDVADRPLREGYVKSGDSVVCLSAESEHGIIELVVRYETADPQKLIDLATADLVEIQLGDALTIKAIDLHLIDPTVKRINIGDYIRVTSIPNGYDAYMVCRSIVLHPDNPASDTYELGTEHSSLTGEQSARLAELNSSVSIVEAAATDAAKTATDYVGTDIATGSPVVGDMTRMDLGKNVLIDDDSVDIRDGNTVLASFAENKVELAKRDGSDGFASVEMCGGRINVKGGTAQGVSIVYMVADHLMLGTDGSTLCETAGTYAFDPTTGKLAAAVANVSGTAGVTVMVQTPQGMKARVVVDEVGLSYNGTSLTHSQVAEILTRRERWWTSGFASGVSGTIGIWRSAGACTLYMNFRFLAALPAWTNVLSFEMEQWILANLTTGPIIATVFSSPLDSWVLSIGVDSGRVYLWDTSYGHSVGGASAGSATFAIIL